MVKVCYTCNIDSCRSILPAFPTELVTVPAIGSKIRAMRPVYISTRECWVDKNGKFVDNRTNRTIPQLELYVVGVVHGMCENQAYVEIELHHPSAKEMGLL